MSDVLLGALIGASAAIIPSLAVAVMNYHLSLRELRERKRKDEVDYLRGVLDRLIVLHGEIVPQLKAASHNATVKLEVASKILEGLSLLASIGDPVIRAKLASFAENYDVPSGDLDSLSKTFIGGFTAAIKRVGDLIYQDMEIGNK